MIIRNVVHPESRHPFFDTVPKPDGMPRRVLDVTALDRTRLAGQASTLEQAGSADDLSPGISRASADRPMVTELDVCGPGSARSADQAESVTSPPPWPTGLAPGPIRRATDPAEHHRRGHRPAIRPRCHRRERKRSWPKLAMGLADRGHQRSRSSPPAPGTTSPGPTSSRPESDGPGGRRDSLIGRCPITWFGRPPGCGRCGGPGRDTRFPVELDTPGTDRDRIGDRILGGDTITIQDQQRWMNDSLRSSGLWDHVFDHGHRYRALVFAPYMFWTTYAVSAAPPGAHHPHALPPRRAAGLPRAVRVDDGRGPRRVVPDRARAGPGRASVSASDRPGHRRGLGRAARHATSPTEFRSEFGIDGPYVYYGGRREWGKGWDDLLRLHPLPGRNGGAARPSAWSPPGSGTFEVPRRGPRATSSTSAC